MKLQREFADLSSTYDGAIFSSFVFGSDHFEKTLLKILSGKSLAEEIVVCVDSGSYQETIENEEVHLQFAGKEYHLCPIRMPNGRFHPKVYFFASEDRVTAFVGSANLTGPAFDGNKEIVTKFEVQNAEEVELVGPELAALGDIHEFYSQLLDHPVAEAIGVTARQKVEHLLEVTNWVTERETESSTSESTAVLHNLEVPLLNQIESRLANKGEEIKQIDIIAPFYGNSVSVPESLTNEGIDTRVWLQQDRTQVDVAELEAWVRENENAEAVVYNTDRYVHGKILLIETDSAAYCLAGSPNASRAAMLESVNTNKGYANIEVGVFRRSEQLDNFDYLRNDVAAHRIESGIEAFTPKSTSEYRPPEPDQTDTVDLLSVDFTRSEVFEGGRLHGQVLAPNPANKTDELSLSVNSVKDMEAISIKFSGAALSPNENSSSDLYTFSRRVNDKDLLAHLSHPAQVHPTWNGTDGGSRWLSIESRDVDREVESAATNDGVDSVWRTVKDIFLDDGEIRDGRLDFLGSLAVELDKGEQGHNGDADDGVGQANGDENDENDELTEGISLPPYDGPTSSTNPAKQFKGFFETWNEQVRTLRNLLFSDDADNEEILRLTGERLAEFNRTITWLAVARQELKIKDEEIDEFPTELPEQYMSILYSRTEPGRSRNSSVAAQFVHDACEQLESKSEIEMLWDEVGVNIIFGQLIAERLLIDNPDTFEKSVGPDFVQLIDQCRAEYESVGGEAVEAERTSNLLWDHYGELPTTFERASLMRPPSRELRKKSIAQRYVSETLDE